MVQLLQKENDLAQLLSLRERRDEETKREWADTLKEEGFKDDAALDSVIKKLETDLKKARKKEADGEDPEVRIHLKQSWHRLNGIAGRGSIIPPGRRAGRRGEF